MGWLFSEKPLESYKNGFTAKEHEAIEALKARLKTVNIRTLLDMMESREFVCRSIPERWKGVYSSSEGYVSWYAHRRADELRSDADRDELLALLRQNPDDKRRADILRTLAHVCRNRNDHDLLAWLIGLLPNENADCKEAILFPLRNMPIPPHLDTGPIKDIVRNKTRGFYVWSAIVLLGHSADPDVESLLLDVLTQNKNKRLRDAIAYSLGKVGTNRCLPALTAMHKRTRDADLRSATEHAIQSVQRRMAGKSQE